MQVFMGVLSFTLCEKVTLEQIKKMDYGKSQDIYALWIPTSCFEIHRIRLLLGNHSQNWYLHSPLYVLLCLVGKRIIPHFEFLYW